MAQETIDLSGIPQLSYEQAREELVRLVARIESGDAPLEEAMSLWERGEALASHCQATLDRAQERLDASTQPADSAPTAATSAPSPDAEVDGGQGHAAADDTE